MKTSKIKAFILAIFTFVILLPGITADKIIIGFLMDDLFSERWYKDRDYITQYVKELGGEVEVRIANNDTALQFSQSKELIEMGAKVLIVVAADGNAAASIVKYAHQKGVKVISHDRLIKNCKLDYYVSFDAVRIGEMQAEYAIGKKPEGNYVMIKGPERDNNAILIAQGQMNILKPHIEAGKIKLIYNKHLKDWSQMDAYMEINELITSRGKDIDVIIASQDKLSDGVVLALEEAELSGKVIVTGMDANIENCQHIIKGKQAMTFYKDVAELAKNSAELAMKLAKNESVDNTNATVNNGMIEVPSILLTPVIVTKDNMKKIIIESGYHKESDIYP